MHRQLEIIEVFKILKWYCKSALVRYLWVFSCKTTCEGSRELKAHSIRLGQYISYLCKTIKGLLALAVIAIFGGKYFVETVVIVITLLYWRLD